MAEVEPSGENQPLSPTSTPYRPPPGLEAPSRNGDAPQSPSISQGSAQHGSGNCRPCVWYWKSRGCQNGGDCFHCHLCPKGEIKWRKKAKMEELRKTRQDQQGDAQDPTSPSYASSEPMSPTSPMSPLTPWTPLTPATPATAKAAGHVAPPPGLKSVVLQSLDENSTMAGGSGTRGSRSRLLERRASKEALERAQGSPKLRIADLLGDPSSPLQTGKAPRAGVPLQISAALESEPCVLPVPAPVAQDSTLGGLERAASPTAPASPWSPTARQAFALEVCTNCGGRGHTLERCPSPKLSDVMVEHPGGLAAQWRAPGSPQQWALQASLQAGDLLSPMGQRQAVHARHGAGTEPMLVNLQQGLSG